MTLKFMDGFGHYASADLLKKWTTGSTGNTINTSGVGPRGGNCLQGSSNGSLWLKKVYGGTVDTAICGFRINQTITMGATTNQPLVFYEGATVHVTIAIDGSGFLRAYRGLGTTLLGTAVTGALTAGSFYFVEAKVKVHDTTGTIEVRVNGATVLNLTAQDSRNGGTGYIDGIGVFPGLGGGANNGYLADVYMCDNAGSTNNDFLGDVRIDTLFPTADGTYSAFTCSTGSSHFALVDEATPNTSDYNSGAASGDKDTYAMGNLSAVTGTIFGIQVCDAVLKDDAGARSAGTQIRSGSTDATGASVALSTSQLYLLDVWETDPNTSAAWTETNINAMEAGCKVTA